jgi:predicted permease
MQQLQEIVNIVLPVFLVVGLGYGLRLIGFVTEPMNQAFSRLVFYVAVPAILFRGVAVTTLSQPIGPETLGGLIHGSVLLTFLVKVVGGTWLVTIVTSFAVYLAGARLGPAQRGPMAQGVIRSNLVFVGLPIIINAYGQDVLGPAAVYISFITIMYNFIAVIVLTLPHASVNGQRLRLTKVLRDLATNPLIISCVAGLLFSGLGGKLPKSLDLSFKLVGDISMSLALIVVGAAMDLQQLRRQAVLPVLAALVKLVIYPAGVFLVLRGLGVSGETLKFAVLLLATPAAVMSAVMAREMNCDGQLAGAIIIASTVLSMFTLSAWLLLYTALGI